ncbi:MAG: helix-turn-helix transcriptional regulator [Candidatus Limnocylindria bacterium]
MPDPRLLVSPVLVGRDDLLVLADRRIAEVAEGSGRFLLLAGDAGLGKSRLVASIERRAVAAGFRSFRGGTYPSDLQVAAAVLLDLARSLRRSAPGEGIGAALAARLDAGASGVGDGHRRRRLLALDVADLLLSIADAGPAIVVLEDLHWSDDLTLEILEGAARQVAERPLLLVGTYRSDELFPRVPMRDWRARLVTQRLAEEVRLRRLTVDETSMMLTALAGSDMPPPHEVAAAVHARSDGIPLHIEELHAVMASPPESADSVRLADVPDTLETAVLARMAARSPHAIEVARAGAVVGQAFDIELLAGVLDRAPDDLADPMAELIEHFLLQPTHVAGRYGFRHALLCDVIYEHVPEPERRRLHDRIADAARARPDLATDAFSALHLERAGRSAEAYDRARAAGAAAAALSSHGEARDLLAIALRCMPADVPALERALVHEAFAGRCAATDRNADAARAYEAARSAYLEAGSVIDAARVVAPLVGCRHLLGAPLAERRAALEEAIAELPTDPTALETRATLEAGLAAAFMLARDLDAGIAAAGQAGRLARAGGLRAIERHAATTLGVCQVFAGAMEEGWRNLEASIAGTLELELEEEAARAYRMLGTSASVLVEYERAERWLREGIAYAESVQLWNHRHYMAAHLAHVLWATGRWDEAEVVARHALADGRGGITTRITARIVLGYITLGRGVLAEAAEHLGEAHGLGLRMAELQRLSPALWGLAELALAEGNPAAALAHCRAAAEASGLVDDAAYLFPFLVTGVRAALAAGDPGAARAWTVEVGARVQARGIPGTLPAIDHARGLVELADGRTALAREHLGRAASAWQERGRVWEGTFAQIDLARALARAGLHGPAGQALAAARARAAPLGSPPIERAIDEVGRASHRAGQEPAPWDPLSAREFEVARLVATGRTNGEIATELGVATRTVSAHIEHILAKLGVARRAEIAAWAASRSVLHSGAHGEDR